MELPALALELELDALAAHLDVAIAQRREAERVVLLRIAFVAHADACSLEQLHDRREHLRARQSCLLHVLLYALADVRQRLPELDHVLELVRVAPLAPALVVAILLAPARVAARGLQVSALVAAD